MLRSLAFPVAVALFALASCTAPAPPPRPAAPIPVPRPAPVPTPTPSLSADWRDWPLTPGDWVYRQDGRGSIALFGVAGQEAVLTLRCDRERQRLYFSRLGVPAAAAAASTVLTVRTSTTSRSLTAMPTGGVAPYWAAELGVRDALADAMGYSRGRFVVTGAGGATLVVPAWPEILRVAEDCRG
jgi:hypothetical protein